MKYCLVMLLILSCSSLQGQDLRQTIESFGWEIDKSMSATELNAWWIKDVILFLEGEVLLGYPESRSALMNEKSRQEVRVRKKSMETAGRVNRIVTDFDKNGNRVSQTSISNDINMMVTWSYDTMNRLVGHTMRNLENNIVTFKEEYRYSSLGQVLVNLRDNPNRYYEAKINSASITIFVYENKKLFQEISIDFDSNCKPLQIEEITKWPTTSSRILHKYAYDGENRLVAYSQINLKNSQIIVDLYRISCDTAKTIYRENVSGQLRQFSNPDIKGNWTHMEVVTINPSDTLFVDIHREYW